MTIDSLVHSNPTSPVMAHTGHQGPSAERRKRLRKPSIDGYFMQMQTSTRRESLTWSGVNSKRVREDDGGRPEASKRMYSS